MQGMLIKRMQLEEAMCWLSTLGGAYSSLGDYYESHVSRNTNSLIQCGTCIRITGIKFLYSYCLPSDCFVLTCILQLILTYQRPH